MSRLTALRESLRGAANRGREGRFSCDGCVAWCCREGRNAMRATPAEAEAVARWLEARGALEDALRRCARTVERWRLEEEPSEGRTFTCPFLDPSNRCGIHPVKPLGCVTFTPVRDGGCDQDAGVLGEALARIPAARGRGWTDLPLPLALAAVRPRGG